MLVVLMCMPGCGGTDKLWTVYDQQKTPAGKVSILEEILSQDPEAYRMERVEGQVEPQKVSADTLLKYYQAHIAADDLSVLGLAWHNFHDVENKGPAGWDECIEYWKKCGEEVDALVRLQKLGYKVVWGVNLRDVPDSGLATCEGHATLLRDATVDISTWPKGWSP